MLTGHVEQIALNGIAHGVQRQIIGGGTERIFQLFRQRIPRQKGVGDKHRDKRRHVVQIADQRERQQRAEQVHGALQDQGIGEWHRGGRQPFTTAQHVRQLIEFVVHQPVGDVAELARLPQLANFVADQQQDPVGGH